LVGVVGPVMDRKLGVMIALLLLLEIVNCKSVVGKPTGLIVNTTEPPAAQVELEVVRYRAPNTRNEKE